MNIRGDLGRGHFFLPPKITWGKADSKQLLGLALSSFACNKVERVKIKSHNRIPYFYIAMENQLHVIRQCIKHKTDLCGENRYIKC